MLHRPKFRVPFTAVYLGYHSAHLNLPTTLSASQWQNNDRKLKKSLIWI